MDAIEGVIYLCKCAVNGQAPDKEIIEKLDLEAVYREASRHMLTAMIGGVLKDAGIETPYFKQAIAAAQRKTVTLNYERNKVFQELDNAGIWYVALKGSVIKDWYPKFEMRQSADCDVLFDRTREEDVRDIMVSLGYEVVEYGGGHHDVYYKRPLTNIQMHVELFGVGYEKKLNDYFADIKNRLRLKSGFEYEFGPEDLYIYLIAHEYDHYQKAGTGLRSVLDTYAFLKKYDLDWEYLGAEIAKLGIAEFEEKNRSLANDLFGDGELTEADKEMLGYVLASGTFGTIENSVNNKIEKYGGGIWGRIRYAFHRLILPIDVVKYRFPSFYKNKFLLPFLPLYRIFRGLTKNRRKLGVEWSRLRE